MKKIINFLVVLLICISTLKAQTYLPLFVPDSTEWSVHVIGVNGSADISYHNTYGIAQIGIDTFIYSIDGYSGPLADSLKISVNIENSKAWVYIDSLDRDLLIYDIALELGDSFKVYSYYDTIFDSTYLHVDSVYQQDGRKVIEFENKGFFSMEDEGPFWQFSFIEGVGPQSFFNYWLSSNYISAAPLNIICKHVKDTLNYESFYRSFSYEDCEPEGVPIKEINFDKVLFYPNPTSNYIYMNSDYDEFSIFNLKGKLLVTERGNNKELIDVSILNKGIYFVKVTNGDRIFVNKLIKN